ncbi:hypothetical protein GCM10020331_025800 [Ectobacillus funiculus]
MKREAGFFAARTADIFCYNRTEVFNREGTIHMQTVQLSEQVSFFPDCARDVAAAGMGGMDKQELLRLIEECLEMGITTFDHADIYGDYSCEALFGQALREKPALRSAMQIVTKCGIKLRSAAYPEHLVNHYDTSKEHIIRSVENSLRHFGTDYVDTLFDPPSGSVYGPGRGSRGICSAQAGGKGA